MLKSAHHQTRAAMTPKIIAHRGASSQAPENTLVAIQLAWEQSADGVEVDLHMTQDHRLAVIHDANTKRTTGKSWRVAAHTLQELKTLDAGQWKHQQWTGEKIPALEEILTHLPAGKTLTLEIKCGTEAIAPLKRILKHRGNRCVAIASFSWPVVTKAREELPGFPIYWICNFRRQILRRRWTPSPIDLIEKARTAGLDGVYFRACGAITPTVVRAAKEAGLELHVWTVDTPALARKMLRLGVDSITTNRPRWLRKRFKLDNNLI